MFKYFKVICKVIFPLIWSYFTCLLPYSFHPEKRSLELRFRKVQHIIRKVLKAFNINYHAYDLEEFYKNRNNDENYLFVCNHISDLDPLIFIALSPRPITFVAKIESKKFPLVGRAVKILSGEFMDRDDLKQSLKVMMNVQKRLESDEKIDFMIFPEGTRNKGDVFKILPYHHGTFRPAFKANKNIISFAITGDNKVLTLKDKSKKHDVFIRKCALYTPEDYKNMKTTELAMDCENKTNKVLAEMKNELMS